MKAIEKLRKDLTGRFYNVVPADNNAQISLALLDALTETSCQAFSALLKDPKVLEEYCKENDIPTVRGRPNHFQQTRYDRLIKFRDWLSAKLDGRER